MTGLSDITALFSRWIDTAASAVVSAFSSLGKRKTVQVIEEGEGSFVIQAAGRNAPGERVQIIDGELVGSHPDSIAAMLDGSRARRNDLLRLALECDIANIAASLETLTLSALSATASRSSRCV